MFKHRLRKLYMLVLLLVAGSAIPTHADVDNPGDYVVFEDKKMSPAQNFIEFRYADRQYSGVKDAIVEVEIYVTVGGQDILLGKMPRCHDEMQLFNTDYGVLHVWGSNTAGDSKDKHGNTNVRTVFMRYYPTNKAFPNIKGMRLKARWDIDDDGKTGADHDINVFKELYDVNYFEGLGEITSAIYDRPTSNTISYSVTASSKPTGGFEQEILFTPGGACSMGAGDSMSGTLPGTYNCFDRQIIKSQIFWHKVESVKNNSYGSKGREYNDVEQFFWGNYQTETLDRMPELTGGTVSLNPETFKAVLYWGYMNPEVKLVPLTVFRREEGEPVSRRVKVGEVDSKATSFTDNTEPGRGDVKYVYELVYVNPSWNERAGSETVRLKFLTEPVESVLWKGAGTENSPYLIENETDLRRLSKFAEFGYSSAGKYWKQTADIDLGGEARPWTTIAYGPDNNLHFSGCYDGGGFEIRNLYINNPGHSRVGLFGNVNAGAVIENVRVTGADIHATDSDAAVLAARVHEGATIRNCFVQGNIESTNDYVGGILGYSDYCYVENTAFVGTVGGKNYVGGFAGHLGARVSYCYSAATVTGNGTTGAFAGDASRQTVYAGFYDSSLNGNMGAAAAGTVGGVVGKSTEDFARGSIAWSLNDSQSENPTWYQTIGTDTYPLLDKTHKVVGKWDEGYYSNDPIPWTEGNGTKETPYLISNEAQLRALATYTNGKGATAGKFWRQTADIDLGGQARPWIPIGSESIEFHGSYNGGGFAVSNIYIAENRKYSGFFGNISQKNTSEKPVIENLRLLGATVNTDSTTPIAGILAGAAKSATIRNCYAEGTVSGLYYVSGLVGNLYQSTVENCGFAGSVTGSSFVGGLSGFVYLGKISNSYAAATVTAAGTEIEAVGAFCGFEYLGQITNCYYNNSLNGEMKGSGIQSSTGSNDIEGLAPKTTDDFASGQVTWLLNGSKAENPTWYQTLGTDTYPLLDKTHKAVCEWNEGYFSNDPMPWTEGNGTKETPYIISNEAQLRALATYTNSGGATAGKFWKQTADIDLGGQDRPWTPIGVNDRVSKTFPFNGSYNGGGFTVSNMYCTSGSISGFFGPVSGYDLSELPLIENICLKGAEVTLYDHYIGTLAGDVKYATIRNCYAAAAVNGSQYVGGLAGNIVGSTFENCGFVGTVDGIARVGGFAGSSDELSRFINCYSAATVTGTGSERIGAFIGSIEGVFTNCYYDNTLSGSMKGVGNFGSLESFDIAGIVPKTINAFACGEVAWLLNGSQSENPTWYQTLGTDTYPLLDATHKVVDFWGNGYHNEPFPWAEGDGTKETPYIISNEAELRALAVWANAGGETAGKFWKQTADIDLGGQERPWEPIGIDFSTAFKGNYNGGGFTVSNMYCSDRYISGLFSQIEGTDLPEQPVIENIRLKGVNLHMSDNNEINYVGALVGVADCVTIRNCYAEGAVRGNNHVGGLVGQINGSTVENCGFVGTVSGAENVGGLMTHQNWKFNKISNCYAAATVSATGLNAGAFCESDGGIYTNCYYDSTLAGTLKGVGIDGSTESQDVEGLTPKTTEQFKSGEVTWLLNGSKAETPAWYQTLGTDTYPLLDATHKTVYFWGGHYLNEACPWAEGEGTAEAPILIQNEADLRKLAEWTNAGNITDGIFWKQTADIDLGGEARPWIPIGVDYNIPFKGNYNGGGYTISNLCCKENLLDPNLIEPEMGLFGIISGDEGAAGLVLENIRVRNAVFVRTAGGIAGIIAGRSAFTTIRNNMVQGEFSQNGDPSAFGGIVGSCYRMLIENCAARITVKSAEQQGGIAVLNEGTTIRNCYAAATFSNPTKYTGAIYAIDSAYHPGAAENCYYDSTLSSGIKGIGNMVDRVTENPIFNTDGEGCFPKTTEAFKSGEVTWLLNGSQSETPTWYQTIYMDDYPLLDATHKVVYSDGTRYYNNVAIWQGAGTKEVPYLISNETELRSLAVWTNNGGETAGKFWKQTADIDLGGQERPWTPIGVDYDSSFKGNYNGGGYTISNLCCRLDMQESRPNSVEIGFFGRAFGEGNGEKLVFENIRIKNASMATGGGSSAGIVFAILGEAFVRNCMVQGEISSSDDVYGIVGGIAGEAHNSTIENCAANVSITGAATQGGVAGHLYLSAIRHCYAAATFQSPKKITGAVYGADSVYGGGVVENCFYDNTLSSGIKGIGFRSLSIDNEIYNTDGEGCTPKTTEQFASGEVTWLLNGSQSENPVWYQTLGEDAYPLLDATHKEVYSDGTRYYNNVAIWKGAGTKESPYLIRNEDELRALATWTNGGGETIGKFWKQTADIDLGGEARPWTPIGNVYTLFYGNYNGGGFTVRNMHVYTGSFSGFFGYIAGKSYDEQVLIENIRIKNASFEIPKHYRGGLSGQIQYATVRNCYAEGSVSGVAHIGGLVGVIYDSTVENCGFVGTVSGTDYVGGFVGFSNNSIDTNCYAAATVAATGTQCDGAFCGGAQNQQSLTNCYYDSTLAGTMKGIGINGSVASEDVEGLTPKTTEAFKSGEVTWLLNGSTAENPTWYQTLGEDTYPTLNPAHGIVYCWPDGTYHNSECADPNWTGEGTAESPYLIQNLEDLKYLAKYAKSNPTAGVCWKQTADIDFSGVADWNEIGSIEHPFRGNYNGGGFRISNMAAGSGQIFSSILGSSDSPAIIENMYIDNTVALNDVLAYKGKYVTVRNCYISADINNDYELSGGYFSYLNHGVLKDCVFTGRVKAQDVAGGFVGNTGESVNSTVEFRNCYVSAEVETTSQINAGQFVGYADGKNLAANCWYDNTRANGVMAFFTMYGPSDLGVQSKPALEGTALAAELGIANWNFTAGVLPVQKIFEPENIYDITFDDSFNHDDITADIANATVRLKKSETETWATVQLPFALTESQLAGWGEFYEFTGYDAETNKAKFKEVTSTVEGGCYLWKRTANSEYWDAGGVTVISTGAPQKESYAVVPAEFAGTQFQVLPVFGEGIYKLMDIGSGENEDCYFGAVAEGELCKSFSAVLFIEGVQKDRIEIELTDRNGITTGIMQVEIDYSNGTYEVYDLYGRRLPKPVQGFNIINGKKVYIK